MLCQTSRHGQWNHHNLNTFLFHVLCVVWVSHGIWRVPNSQHIKFPVAYKRFPANALPIKRITTLPTPPSPQILSSLPSLCHLSSSIFFPSHQQPSCLPNLRPVRASRRVCPILCPPIHHHRPSERSRKVQNQSSQRELTAAPYQEFPRRTPLPEPNPQVSTGINLQTFNRLSLVVLHNRQVLNSMTLVQRSKLRCHLPLPLLSPTMRMRVSIALT